MNKIRTVLPPIILAVVSATATYWIFYGSTRYLNISGAIILALSLFSIRKNYRVTYGLIEI
jgi:hypothetical protein